MEIDVGTRAILKLALLPPGSLLILLLLGWLFARRFLGRLLILLAITLLYFLSTPIGLHLLASQLETVPALTPPQAKAARADAILVFLADLRQSNPERNGADSLGPLSLQRMDYALSLHRVTGLPIIPSGGSVRGDTAPAARLAVEWLRQQAGVNAPAADESSRDTRENALHSAELLTALGFERVLLVTHASHMPRAMLSARAAGVDAIPAPFDFEHAPPDRQDFSNPMDWLPQAGYLGRSYRILHEMVGLVWYGMSQRQP